ncbi:hypothetical protein Lser_V15G15325 [Lactuca serriola]
MNKVFFLLPMLCQITMEIDGCRLIVSSGAYKAVKYCYQPINISFTNGVIKITNTNFFQTTEDLEFNWVIEGDGCKLDSGTLSLPTLEFNWVIEGDFGS